MFCFCRISDCSDHVTAIFTGSHDFVIQAFSAMLLAKLVSSDPRLLIDQVEQVLHAISTALARLPQVSIGKLPPRRVLPEILGGLPKPSPYLRPKSAIFPTLLMA